LVAGGDQAIAEEFEDAIETWAIMAAMKRALRTALRAPPIMLLPFHWPDWTCARPARLAMRFFVRTPRSDSSVISVRAVFAPSREVNQVFGLAPGWRGAHHGVQLLLQPCDEARQAPSSDCAR
jgi:hypothetical protein